MRAFSVILCLIIALTLFGCSNDSDLKAPVEFYYCVREIDHADGGNVFEKETRESAPFSDDLVGLLNLYFEGPANDKYYSPFPEGSKILEASREGNVLTLHLSAHFDNLALDKLSLAIACLVQTTYQYTSAPVVLLIPNSTFIDGSTYKTFTTDSFLYSDRNTNYSSPQ